MSQLSDAEVDASLFALGIGSDARGTRVLIASGHGQYPLAVRMADRLAAFGAHVDWGQFADENSASASYDYLLAFAGDVYHQLDCWLKPGGRYMILLDGIGDESKRVGITEVTTLGVSAIRAIGCKLRGDGE